MQDVPGVAANISGVMLDIPEFIGDIPGVIRNIPEDIQHIPEDIPDSCRRKAVLPPLLTAPKVGSSLRLEKPYVRLYLQRRR
jgi:hypothetical protein